MLLLGLGESSCLLLYHKTRSTKPRFACIRIFIFPKIFYQFSISCLIVIHNLDLQSLYLMSSNNGIYTYVLMCLFKVLH